MQSTKGRILCTEDDVDTRELIDFVLTQYGYEVVCAASNVQAIDLAKTQTFDLYLVDNWMPGLSGTELTEKFRQFDVKTPVLFYSGAAYATDLEAARISGAQGYLVKPANGDELITEVKRLIAESKTTLPLENRCITAEAGGARIHKSLPVRRQKFSPRSQRIRTK